MKKKIIGYLIVILALFSFDSAFGQASALNDSINAANQLYSAGKYKEAIPKYQHVLDKGVEAPELYYNLGNAHFKSGNYTAAILNFERAKKLSPNDENINYNLELARTQIVDNLAILPEPGFMRWIKEMISARSIHFWSVVSIVTFYAFLILFGAFLLSGTFKTKRLTFWLSIGCFVIALITFSFGSSLKNRLVNHNTAVISDRSVRVKASPSETGTELFIVHEGLTVSLSDQLGDWVYVALPDGNKGWIKESSLIRI